jgi:hypothetical protein
LFFLFFSLPLYFFLSSFALFLHLDTQLPLPVFVLLHAGCPQSKAFHMAPKKKPAPKPLTEGDMRRMGMPEEEIQRILALKAMSGDERRAEDAREQQEAADKKEKERCTKLQTQQLQDRKAVDDAEVLARRDVEQRLIAEFEHGLVPIVSACRLDRSRVKLEEARSRRSKEMADYESRLAAMSPEERAAKLAEQALALERDEVTARNEQLQKDIAAAEIAQERQEKIRRREEKSKRMREMREELARLGIPMGDDTLDASDGDVEGATEALERKLSVV